MAHEIEFVDGVAQMAYAGGVPWHGLGVKVPSDLTPEQMLDAAGLNWEVQKFPTFAILDENDPESVIETKQSALVRTKDKKLLDVVSDDWNPVQNAEAFDFFNEFVMAGDMEMHTAGSLKDGQIVWGLAKVKDSFELFKGDVIDSYLLFSNFHKYGFSTDVRFTPIRVVCNNTLTMAHHNGESQLMRVKHSANIEENMKSVFEIMNLANNAFETTLEQYRLLANKEINSKDLEKYIKLVFKLDEDKENAGKRLLNNIIPLFEQGRGNDMKEIKGTYWAAYNSISEYLQYEKKGDEQVRLNNLWFGTSKTTLERALETAVKLVA
jgi:phage/plasmid-like protein (TIGR03299 family)